MTGQQHEITITRGESFSIDKLIVNQDGSPFIVSNRLSNPCFLLKIAQSKYSQSGSYYLNVWIKVPEELCFYSTRCIEISSLESQPDVDIGEYTGDKSTYAIYYIVDNDGNKIYKRWTGLGYEDYQMRISYTFDSGITEQWTGQNYMYSIDLVDGITTNEYIDTLYKDNISDAEATVEDKYSQLLLYDTANNTDYMKDVDLLKEIHRIIFSIPILGNTRLTVNSGVYGGLYE